MNNSKTRQENVINAILPRGEPQKLEAVTNVIDETYGRSKRTLILKHLYSDKVAHRLILNCR